MLKKKNGALLVEFILLLVVVLTVSSIFISFQQVIEKNGLLFHAINRSIYNEADEIYLQLSAENLLLEEVSSLEQKRKVADYYLTFQVADIIENQMLKSHGFLNKSEFYAYYHLKELEYDCSFERNAILIETKAVHSFSSYFGDLLKINLDDRHVIPIKNIDFSSNNMAEDELIIFITKNGKEHSKKYHLHICWSLKNAKYIETVKLSYKEIKIGNTIEFEGSDFQLCSICKNDLDQIP